MFNVIPKEFRVTGGFDGGSIGADVVAEMVCGNLILFDDLIRILWRKIGKFSWKLEKKNFGQNLENFGQN